MSLETKSVNPVAGRVWSGKKTVGSYEYHLYLEIGQNPTHMIMRIKNDESEAKWYAVPTGNDYATPWADPSNVLYTYIDAAAL